jgi:hypothetical protein
LIGTKVTRTQIAVLRQYGMVRATANRGGNRGDHRDSCFLTHAFGDRADAHAPRLLSEPGRCHKSAGQRVSSLA